MTTIILVAIGILIAAAAALFVIFYGGSAFSSVKAQAVTLENAGSNVESAYQGYRVEYDAQPAALADLKTASAGTGWLAADPAVAGSASGAQDLASVSGALLFRIKGVLTADVCKRVNLDYGAGAVLLDDTTGARRGCAKDGAGYQYFINLGASSASAAPAKPLADTVVATPSYMQLIANAIYDVSAFNAVLGYYPNSLGDVQNAGYLTKPVSDNLGHSVYGFAVNPDNNGRLFTFGDGVSAADCQTFNNANGNGNIVLPIGGATPAFGCVAQSDGRLMPYMRIDAASPNVSGYTSLLDNSYAGWQSYQTSTKSNPSNLQQTASYAPGPYSSPAGNMYGAPWTPDGSPLLVTYDNGVDPSVCKAINVAYGNGSVILQSPAVKPKGCMHISDGRLMPYVILPAPYDYIRG